MNLHRSFGPGLKELYNPVTKNLNTPLLKQHYKLAQTEIFPFDGASLVIDGTKTTSFVLGWVVGV